MKNKYISYVADGILAGMMIGIGAIVLMSCANRYIGAFLFSLGLFSIVALKYGLYTGKVGYIVCRDKAFALETVITLAANAFGTFAAAYLFRATRLAKTAVAEMEMSVIERSKALMETKINDSALSVLGLAFFCGILMFTAVEIYRKCSKSGNYAGAVFGVVMPVFVFIICGFNHSIADMAYYFLAGCPNPGDAMVYFVLAALGNALGGVFVPLLKKLSVNALNQEG